MNPKTLLIAVARAVGWPRSCSRTAQPSGSVSRIGSGAPAGAVQSDDEREQSPAHLFWARPVAGVKQNNELV